MSAPDTHDVAYEAMVFSARLPMRTIAFIYRDGEPKFGGGIYRIVWVRAATAQDKLDFPLPPDGVCPLCGQDEPA